MSRLIFLAAGTALLIVGVLALLWMLQRRLIFFPFGGAPAVAEAGLAGVEQVSFETSDGLTLNAWFVPAMGPPPHVTVLVFNGNAGNRLHRVPLAAELRRRGCHVLLTDYRGYGGNPGTPSEPGLAADARAARAYLLNRPEVAPSRLVYFGESLGTAVAVDLAAEHPPAALVLRSPFTSIVEIGQHHYPFIPVRLLLRDRFAAIDQIARIHVPLLVVAGERDSIIPIEYSRRLYEAANEPKTLVVLPNADHNDYELLAGEDMVRTIAVFLREVR
jgi:hypothetical protein